MLGSTARCGQNAEAGKTRTVPYATATNKANGIRAREEWDARLLMLHGPLELLGPLRHDLQIHLNSGGGIRVAKHTVLQACRRRHWHAEASEPLAWAGGRCFDASTLSRTRGMCSSCIDTEHMGDAWKPILCPANYDAALIAALVNVSMGTWTRAMVPST
jgi:hypothetical protein